jgi:hypothetical protein
MIEVKPTDISRIKRGNIVPKENSYVAFMFKFRLKIQGPTRKPDILKFALV